ncbi:MAG: hypothetical protein J6A75_12200 [Lachnospiraceae bacterium]|nr:hypothetical protein [Lachnospiraceae bacterium]
MTYEAFKNTITISIQNHFGEQAQVTLHPIIKNNHVVLDGLTIHEKNLNISPTIYLNYYYDDYLGGKSLSEIQTDILNAYEQSRSSEHMDFSFFTDYQKVKYRIVYKLIHYEKNKELLKDVPYIPFLDFAIVFCCLILNAPGGNATILIHNHHLTFWNTTTEQLYALAQKNTPVLLPFEVQSMEDVLKTFCTDSPVFTDVDTDTLNMCPMFVLTNSSKLFGASCILYPNLLDNFANKIQSDLYIIPSSIHEVLLVPADHSSNISHFNRMIRDVNATQVQDEEILSNHVYFYSRSKGLINP